MLVRSKRAAAKKSAALAAASSAEKVHALGPENAPVVLEEFGDFQCPPCGTLSEPLNQLERDFRGKLRIVFRNFPLAMHAHARAAAAAAEAAGLQGKFWEMHDQLFREQSVWTKAPDTTPLFNTYAAMLHLDTIRFAQDMKSPQVLARIANDEARGKASGVSTTPSVFINSKPVTGPGLAPPALRKTIEEALRGEPPK